MGEGGSKRAIAPVSLRFSGCFIDTTRKNKGYIPLPQYK